MISGAGSKKREARIRKREAGMDFTAEAKTGFHHRDTESAELSLIHI